RSSDLNDVLVRHAAPNLTHELPMCQYPAGMTNQGFQEVILGGSELYSAVSDQNFPLGQIHLKVTGCEHRAISLLGSPPQGRAHPRQQFAQPKRLGEVVVSTGVKHCNLVRFLLTD